MPGGSGVLVHGTVVSLARGGRTLVVGNSSVGLLPAATATNATTTSGSRVFFEGGQGRVRVRVGWLGGGGLWGGLDCVGIGIWRKINLPTMLDLLLNYNILFSKIRDNKDNDSSQSKARTIHKEYLLIDNSPTSTENPSPTYAIAINPFKPNSPRSEYHKNIYHL